MISWLVLFFIVGIGPTQAEDIVKISMPVIHDLQRADVYILRLTDHPSAILVLSPGVNGNGKAWIQNSTWQRFAQDHNLALVGLSFASDGELLMEGRGYYYPSQGSGKLLLEVLSQAFHGEPPLLLYGFSGGAHFTSGFASWKPERVLGWCAYSAEWWEKPILNNQSPPGLVMCGDVDERYGASLLYFKQGRALHKPWLWVSVPQNDHWISPKAESFAREYFTSLLHPNDSKPVGAWVDIDLRMIAEPDTVNNQPSLTGWLPDSQLLPKWQGVHQP